MHETISLCGVYCCVVLSGVVPFRFVSFSVVLGSVALFRVVLCGIFRYDPVPEGVYANM